MSDDRIRMLLRQAARLREAGRLADAEAAYHSLLELEPNLPDSWYNLGLVQRQLGKFTEALASYQLALDRGARQAEEIHLNRGVIYADELRQDKQAEDAFAAALACNPNYVPALLNLGNLAEDRGRRDEALASYERVLRIDPRCYMALARSAMLRPGVDDGLINRLRQTILMGGASPSDRAALGFALGKLLDQRGAYDEAFAAYAAANRAVPHPPYDRAGMEALVDSLIATFPKALPPTGTAPSLFICGMFRSGSTLTEQVLAGHPRVTAGGEIDFFGRCAGDELSPYPDAVKRTPAETFAAIAARYRNRIGQLFPDADIGTDKRPDNFLHIGLIKTLFPDARIIHTVRHPLDICLSVYFTAIDQPYAHDLMDVAHYLRQYRRLMAHWKSCFGGDILDFDYDALVREPRPAVERLIAFCGLDWDDACLAFHETRNTVKTASVWQVREPLYQRSSGRWRHYASHLAEVQAYLDQGGG